MWSSQSGSEMKLWRGKRQSIGYRAQHEYKYFHGYLWVHPWENLYKQITCVQVPGT